MATRLQFDLGPFPAPAQAARRAAAGPFRMLVCADLAGAARAPLAERRPLRVDVDTLDAVIARLSPRIALPEAADAGTLTFEAMADFHPDHLAGRVDALARLRQARAGLALHAVPGQPAPTATNAPPAATFAGAQADIERLLGRPPSAPPVGPTLAAPALDAWIRELVQPHVVPGDEAARRARVALVDDALATRMRALLRAPAFRRLEATWRGIERLVAALGGEESIALWLLDVRADELLEDLQAAPGEPSRWALSGLIGGPDSATPESPGWSLVVVDHLFGDSPGDVALLAALGSLAARTGAALLGGADASLLRGADSSRPPDDGGPALWNALRATDVAAWIGLAAPRVLMRQPYGRGSDPIESFAFEEADDPEDPDAYLWGNPALLLALLAGTAFVNTGWSMDLAAPADVTDLPAFSWRTPDGARLRACTETPWPEVAAERLLRDGIMPLLAHRDRNALRLPGWRSVATPAQPLRGPWSA